MLTRRSWCNKGKILHNLDFPKARYDSNQKKNSNWPFISKKKLYDIDADGDTRQRKAIGHE